MSPKHIKTSVTPTPILRAVWWGGVCPKGIFAILSPLGPHGQDKLLPAGKGDTRLSWVDKARAPLAAQRQATKSLAHATPQKTITAVVDAHLW